MFLQSDSPFRINISLRTFPLHYHLRNMSIFSHQLFPCLKKLKKGTQEINGFPFLSVSLSHLLSPMSQLFKSHWLQEVWRHLSESSGFRAKNVAALASFQNGFYDLYLSKGVVNRRAFTVIASCTKVRLRVSLQKQLNLKRKQAENRVVSLFVRNAGMSPLGNFREDLENL